MRDCITSISDRPKTNQSTLLSHCTSQPAAIPALRRLMSKLRLLRIHCRSRTCCLGPRGRRLRFPPHPLFRAAGKHLARRKGLRRAYRSGPNAFASRGCISTLEPRRSLGPRVGHSPGPPLLSNLSRRACSHRMRHGVQSLQPRQKCERLGAVFETACGIIGTGEAYLSSREWTQHSQWSHHPPPCSTRPSNNTSCLSD